MSESAVCQCRYLDHTEKNLHLLAEKDETLLGRRNTLLLLEGLLDFLSLLGQTVSARQ